MVQSQHLKSLHTQLLVWVCNLNLIVASSSPLAKPLVSLLQQSKTHKLLAIITNPDKPIGRGQKIEPNSLAAWASDEKIKTYKPSNDSELLNLINELSPQLVITIAFGKIIPEQLLSIPEFGWINVHFSILPKWRGAAPVQWAILSGEKTSGISIFKLDKGMDTGPIYLTHEVVLDSNAKSDEVLLALSDIAAAKTLECLELIYAQKEPYSQPIDGASIAPKFTKNDGKIDWQKSAESIYNLYRAISHNPGVWTNFNEQRLIIDSLRVLDVEQNLKVGEVLINNESLFVGTGMGAIEILRLTPAGRNQMSASEFIRGLTKRTGLYLG